jgi:hypothetical protein
MGKQKENLVIQLIELMSDYQWHSSQELADKISFRFGDAIYRARKSGYEIEKNRLKNNEYEYRLISKQNN